MSRVWFSIGAVLALIAVALGAFAAHGLKKLVAPELVEAFQYGVDYQFIHALGLLVCAWAATQWNARLVNAAAVLFLIGIAGFSLSLYLLVLTEWRPYPLITPAGGFAMMLGWLCLAIAPWRHR